MTSMAETSSAGGAPDNRQRLLDLGASVFASEGYAAVSVRDLAQALGITTGALYSSFRNKGDLLAQVVDAKVREDMEQERSTDSVPEFVAQIFDNFEDRVQMRALLLEAAVASRTDPGVAEKMLAEHRKRFESWLAAYEGWQVDQEVDPSLDMRSLLTFLWSIELGLGVLEALDIDHSDPADRAEVIRHFLHSLEHTSE